LIIGASGYIGAALFRELATVYEVIGTYNTVQFFPELIHLDVTSQESVRNTITSVNPDVIIHTAADSSISYCESNPDQALLVNTKGTQNIVEFANTTDARIIYLSSLGAVDPITQYGKTKLLGEEYVKQTKKGFDILRLSMVFGVSPNLSDDSPFGKIVRTLKTGHPLCYDDTWKFPPTYLPNVSFILRVMLKEHSKNSLTTVAIPELKSMYEIARDILKPFGREVKPKYAHKIGRRLEVVPKSDEFELPVCTYADMVNALINDLKKSKIGSRF
jgi:dTDP-4-dehydrorhamnose reductase